MRLNEDLFQRRTATRHHPPTDRKSDRLTWTHTAPMGFTGWSQRDTLTTGHGHCRDNRRSSIREIGAIAGHFARRGYKLHGFGLKASALRAYASYFVSADSLAWSYQARVTDMRLPGCRHRGPCNNCPR